MRIIAGAYKGRKLTPPKDDRIRPTTDRAREAMFNLLMHGEPGGACIREQRAADICSGTGALGLEALSRGATHACFVDISRTSLALSEHNAMQLGCISQCQFIQADATKLPSAPEPFGCILIDAPYRAQILPNILAQLTQKGWVDKGSIIALEQGENAATPDAGAYEILTERRYGKSMISLLRVR